MRQQIAAANWKMNLVLNQAENLLDEILKAPITLQSHQKVVLAVPFPYLLMARQKTKDHYNIFVSAQNCFNKERGAYTGETSVEMLESIAVDYVVLGHSERREYFGESNSILEEKTKLVLSYGLTPVFCCGEPLQIRESGTQNEYVEKQLEESLFNLPEEQIRKIVIAYEPVWAIGTGKTATSLQAQEMHAYLRQVLAKKYGNSIADEVPILYGGSVKGSNAGELFSQPDVDGGLVGGASLIASDFIQIITALK